MNSIPAKSEDVSNFGISFAFLTPVMAESLLGDLAQTKFFDLLKPLLTGRKSGILMIKGSEDGEILMEFGNIIHARTEKAIGEEAFLMMMGWQEGKATFDLDIPLKEKSIFTPTENLLLNWSYKREEWEKIRKLLPSSGAVFSLSLQSGSQDRNVKGDQWNVLALADGRRTVLEIAKTLEWDEFKTSKVVCEMIQAGLLEKAEGGRGANKRIVKADLFKTIEDELRQIVGPMAPLMIDDVLGELEEAKDSFPEDQVPTFVESLSKAIPHDQKKKEFRKRMIELLSPKK